MAIVATPLGHVSIVPKGQWSTTTAYDQLNLIYNGQNSYLSLTTVPAGTPLNNKNYWMVLAQGVAGPKGEDGYQGEDGEAAGFGNVTASAATLAAGLSATVSVTTSGENTAKNFTFNFGIPKGDKGDKGATGTAAGFDTPTISVSTVSSTTPASATITASGSNTSKKFNFDFNIPKGDQGDSGTGITNIEYVGSTTDSQSRTVDIYTITYGNNSLTTNFTVTNGKNGEKGDSAFSATIGQTSFSTVPNVTNVGTTTDLILDFVLPRVEFEIGNVNTSTGASVTNVGTSTNLKLDFEIPQLELGIGTVSSSTGANVTKTGTTTNPILNFEIPKGDTGDAAGFGTITGNATRLDPNVNPTIIISTSGPDTAKNITFDFGIPQGQTGQTGPAPELTIDSQITEISSESNPTVTVTENNGVKNLHFNLKPSINYICTTTEIEEGSSLTTGTLVFVYEEGETT